MARRDSLHALSSGMLILCLLLAASYTNGMINPISTSSALSADASLLADQNLITSNENDDYYLAQKDNVLEKSYHGLIRENETLVEITPVIKVDEEKICNFRILKKPYHEVPFEIELVNDLGILRSKRMLNCEKRKSYHFEIMAIFCDGTHSPNANVHITVIDINEYAPIFLQPSYVTEVDEGRLYKEIIRVEASDKDCTPLFGDVCKYEILNNDQPFTIDNEGSIRNTEPLSHKISHNHILSVVAYDCAMKESVPIMVNIKVRRVCEARYVGIPERIDYMIPTKEHLPLFPNVRLELCDMYCKEQTLNIHAYIALRTKHISFGCDRDVSNCTNSNRLPMIDLLPRSAGWTKQLSYDEGVEPVFHFDGNSGVIVPESVVAATNHDFSIAPFSIVTIFRHFVPSATAGDNITNQKHVKEHIICSADDHKMNRHHMALFVRNCRLILLLRKNFNEGELNIFSPAEWRWKIPEVCDNEWHHYVLNVDQAASKIELYIDGVLFEGGSSTDRHNNPEVIDDWPLHAAQGVNTTLAVGACYQSSENRLKHGFNGDISEIKLSLNTLLSAQDVKCGSNCAEHLQLAEAPTRPSAPVGTHMQTNTHLNEIFIEAQCREHFENLLKQIQYVNTKEQPTIGRRNIELRTTLICGKNQSSLRLPVVETYIMVNEPAADLPAILSTPGVLVASNRNNSNSNADGFDVGGVTQQDGKIAGAILHEDALMKQQRHLLEEKKIIITGSGNNLVSYTEIKSGVHILADINITIVNGITGVGALPTNEQNLDSCSVIVFPSLNPDHEEIQVDGDEGLSSTLDIKTNINKDGVEMIGSDVIANYIDVLKALVYSNKKPAYYLNRVFKLSCTQFSTQYKSSEFTLTLTVLHPKQQQQEPQQMPLKSTIAPLLTSPLAQAAVLSNRLSRLRAAQASSSASSSSSASTSAIAGLYDNKLYSHAMLHMNDVQEPKSHIRSLSYKESSHPTMLIILICVFLVILLCGVSIARLKSNHSKYNTNRHQPCPKISDESLVWDDSALTITINPMQTDAISEDSTDSENSDTDDEEILKEGFANVNQLEWDNSNMFTMAAN